MGAVPEMNMLVSNKLILYQKRWRAHGLRNEVSSNNEGNRGLSLTLYENEAKRKA